MKKTFLGKTTATLSRGFTLVEMMVIAPIIILMIGGFIALIVSLTGEVMSSRGANVLTYNVQDALNRIEQDVKTSTTFLAASNISLTNTYQGYGGSTSSGSTTPFSNVDKTSSGGSTASIILNALATNESPFSNTAEPVYLRDQPANCTNYQQYSKNKPMSINIVYFVDANNTLWRRVIMPENYADPSVRCGSAPWQVPSCINGYSSSLTFCKTTDERLVSGVSPSDFTFQYYPSASSTAPNSTATNGASSDAVRNTALFSTPTVGVTLTASQTIAGRDITRTATMRATRLDSNASGIATDPSVSVPAAPTVSSRVTETGGIIFTWPRIAGATSYELQYKLNGAPAWSSTISRGTNNRSYTASATHTDTVEVRVRAVNSAGESAYATNSATVPLWLPLPLKNGWINYSGSFSHAAYTKTKTGLVLVKGLIKKAGTVTQGEVIATLPAGYRPMDGTLIFGAPMTSNAQGRVDVSASGNILYNTGAVNDYFSLDNIRFAAFGTWIDPIEGSSARKFIGVAPLTALENDWENYTPAGGGFARASYVLHGNGRATVEGLIRNGTVTSGTTMLRATSDIAPVANMHIGGRSSTFAYFTAASSGFQSRISATGIGGNGYVSTNLSYIINGAPVTWVAPTLLTTWSVYSPANPPMYTKDSEGLVQLRGTTRTTNTANKNIFQLPAGFRPKERKIFQTVHNGAYSRIDVAADGLVIFYGTSTSWYSLDNITFLAEQ